MSHEKRQDLSVRNVYEYPGQSQNYAIPTVMFPKTSKSQHNQQLMGDSQGSVGWLSNVHRSTHLEWA